MIQEEYRRMSSLLNYRRLNESAMEDEQESDEKGADDKSIDNAVNSAAKAAGQIDYKNTQERDVLPFPMKYATVASDVSTSQFIKDIADAYGFLEKEGYSPNKILSILAPHLVGSVNDFTKFTELVDKYKKIEYIPAEELKKYADGAKKRFLEFPSGDEKNIISYKFSANPNKFKLTPTGFWQLQFLARIAQDKYEYPEEETFVLSKYRNIFKGNAIKILKNFYTAVFKKMIPAITGRFHLEKEYRDIDIDQQIMLEDAVEHFISGLLDGKYTASNNNIGAWAMEVMKNRVKEIIRSFTNMSYRTGFDPKSNTTAFDSFVQNNWLKFDSKLSPDNVDPELSDLISSIKPSNKMEGLYTYTFNSPEDAFYAFEMASKIKKDIANSSNPFLLKYLPANEQKRLRDGGALLSVRRDVGFSGDQEDEMGDISISKSQEDSEFIKLYRLFNRLGISMGDNKILNASNDNDNEFLLLRNALRNSKIVDDSAGGRAKILDKDKYNFLLEKGFGEAIYHTLQNIAWDYPIWSVKPSKEFIDALKNKYKKDFSEPKTGAPIGPTYLDSNGNIGKYEICKLNPETKKEKCISIDNFITYKTSTIRGGREKMVNDFIKSQNEKNENGEPSFFPSRDVFSKISQMVDNIKGEEGKGDFLKGRDREEFNRILTNLTGKEIFREAEEITSVRRMVQLILKENISYLL